MIGSTILLLVLAGGFQLHEGNPVLRRGASGWDSGLIDPGAVVYYDGRFHMLFNAIPDWPHPLSIGYASSEDGVYWERHAEPILSTPPHGAWSLRANSVFEEQGTWTLYLSVGAEEGALNGAIHRATAPSPEGPWILDDRPMLEAGESGSWDERAVGEATVLRAHDGYIMYFTGYSAGWSSAIGRATSRDGVHWVKDAEPVLRAGPEGSWDAERVQDASVLREADGSYVMVYASAGQDRSALGMARSQDGIAWRKNTENPIVSNTSEHTFDRVYYNNLVQSPDGLFLYFEARGAGTDNTDVYLMTLER